MQNLNDATARAAAFNRIDALTSESTPLWGKMSVCQMLVHCDLQLQIATGELVTKDLSNPLTRTLVKFLVLQFDGMIQKNMPTAKELYMTGSKPKPVPGNIDSSKQALKDIVTKIANWDEKRHPLNAHPFFGKLNKKQWGRLAYLHLNHHLNQFGV
jgi:hypothetical protein